MFSLFIFSFFFFSIPHFRFLLIRVYIFHRLLVLSSLSSLLHPIPHLRTLTPLSFFLTSLLCPTRLFSPLYPKASTSFVFATLVSISALLIFDPVCPLSPLSLSSSFSTTIITITAIAIITTITIGAATSSLRGRRQKAKDARAYRRLMAKFRGLCDFSAA